MPRSLAALVAVITGACGGASQPPAQTPAKPAPQMKGPAVGESAPAESTPAPRASRLPGVPHSMALERIALSPEGDAAITRDASGRLRFWGGLDGESEPQPIPISSASHVALARAKSAGGKPAWTIALIDTAGGAHLLRARGDGSMTRLADLGPQHSMVDVVVSPGGERVLFLRADRVIELRDATGELLATHDERGFRPSRIRLAGAGTFVALELEPGTRESSVTAYPMKLVERAGTAAIRPAGDGYTVTVKSFAVGTDQATVSPDGRYFAFLAVDPKKNHWEAVVADLVSREHHSVPLSLLPRHQTPALGFVGDRSLIARGGVNGSSWLIDLGGKSGDKDFAGRGQQAPAKSGDKDFAGRGQQAPAKSSDKDFDERTRPLAVRPDIANNAPRAFAKNVMVVGLGNWLYVYRVDRNESKYLGYEQFSPMTAAVSPSGKVVAWGSNNDLFITTASGERLAERQLLRFQTVRHVSFVDEHRVLIAYYTAALELYDWKKGEVVASADGGGAFTAGGYDAAKKLFFVIPQRGQVWVTEVTPTGFRGPYVIADGANRAGFLEGDKALWTFDTSNRLRHYTLAELRRGVSNASAARRGAIIRVSPFNVGPDGRIFGTVYNSGRTHLAVFASPELPEPAAEANPSGPTIDLTNKELVKAPIAAGVSLSEVAPRGDLIAVVSNNVVYVRDISDLGVRWSYPFPNGARSLSWNESGTHLAISTREGAIVFEARSGKPLHTSCGPRFSARTTPPASLHPPNVATSVCERR